MYLCYMEYCGGGVYKYKKDIIETFDKPFLSSESCSLCPDNLLVHKSLGKNLNCFSKIKFKLTEIE